ncbi:ribonuclease J [Candidatus Roizmanbacteria bacterium]|nr:ribonuclease J [Candidatus Roizmanbacteria bacterium]
MEQQVNLEKQFKNDRLRIVFLGGVGVVTKNMFVYEYWKDGKLTDSVIIDCGVGFSEDGEELIVPDVQYLLDKQSYIRGVVLTHGHEDHTSALHHLLAHVQVPIYGSRLTVALAKARFAEYNLPAQFHTMKINSILQLGHFSISFVHVTHSIPDATNIIVKTPVGTFYHASDFKFDWSPVDGWQTEVGKIASVGKQGVLCLLSDCVRSERKGYTLSEETIQESLEIEVRKARGNVFFTTQSSNISRIQQAVNIASLFKRKIVLLGRSMRTNAEVAQKLGYLHFPKKSVIESRAAKKYPPQQLFFIVAGSQGQEDSALSRLADENNKDISIRPHDTIIFSADPIPGYEQQVHQLINKLTILGAEVVYSDINDELHVSGHGAQNDLMLMMGLTCPQYIIPIGGEPRHVRQYGVLAQKMGYQEDQILAPLEKDAVEFTASGQVTLLKGVAELLPVTKH